MITDTTKLLALLMGEDELDFQNEFLMFSEEEQNQFVDAMAEVMARGFREFKTLDPELKSQIMLSALGQMTVEQKTAIAEVMVEG